MKPRLALLALVATACSPEAGNSATNTFAAPTPETPSSRTGGVIAPAAAASTPKPGVLKTFRDWAVGCDNGLTCTMIALGSETAGEQGPSVILTRAAGPDGGWTASLSGEAGDLAGIVVDGKTISKTDAAGIAAAIANGRTASVLGAAVKGAISLAGASAALRYIDARQGRAGGRTAVVAKGPVAASAVPAAPALPVVAALTPSGTAAKPTAAQVAAMAKAAQCEIDAESGIDQTPETYAAGGGTTLVFVPCSPGAYNLSLTVFAMKDGKFAAAQGDVPTGFTEGGGAGDVSVVNGGFEDGFVTSYAKGRGVGDCGVAQKLAWDGTRLRLVEQDEMGECRGSTDMIPTWRARVVRK